MYDTILVPTDGSDHSVRAAEHAAALARVFDASVHVLAVVDVQAAAGAFDVGGVDDEYVDRLDEQGQEHLATTAAVLAELDDVTTATVRGDPTDAILEYAADHDADVIAMGTHGRTGIERFVAGSVTEHVLRHAPIPVLTVRATERSATTDYEEILVPTDGSDPAEAAVDHAVELAAATGARLHAVNVVDLGSIAIGPEGAAPTDVIDALEDVAEAATERIAEQARARDVDVVTAVPQGFPARTLLDYADDHGIDLITMGTAGRTGPSRFLLGSTTERVVRHAEVPVFAVNAREAETADRS